MMAHPSLAARDPLYWIVVLIVILWLPALIWVWRRTKSSSYRIMATVMFLLVGIPALFDALLGTACYFGGNCP